MGLLEEHRILITIGGKLNIDDYCDYITERALNELVCENIVEISDQFEEGRGWLIYYKNLQNKDFSDVKPFEIKYHHITLSEQRALNAAEVVNMCKKIMEILPKKRITRSYLEKVINYDEENDRFFFHALESLNSQGAINFNISTVNRKKSYLEWQNEISKIKEFILQSFKDKDFVSRDFLIYSTNDKFKCLYAIKELIAEKKIVETREKSDLVGGITAYRLV